MTLLRHMLPALLCLTGLVGLAYGDEAAQRQILVLEIDGAIGPASAEYISSGLQRAEAENAALLILRLNTPGGLDTSMRDIIQDILASPVPVATFVAPRGARAASAGTYILYASHIAAMAPGTNLGAATPVNLQGPPTPLPGPGRSPLDESPESGESEDGSGSTPEDQGSGEIGDASLAKAINDAAAYIESLAEMRGRNAEWAVKAVREAASLPASKALEENVIDLIADSVPDLIAALEGWQLDMDGRSVTLALSDLPTEIVEQSWRTKILAIITDPNVALILMMVGVYGLILEFYNPGTFIPGTIGAISLLLGLYALNVLPVNYAGLALVGLGMALIVAEAFAPSFGIFGVGGGVAIVVGATLLIETDAPEFQVSLPFIIGMTVVLGVLMILIMTMALRAHRRPVAAGEESVVGVEAHVVDWSGTSGTVTYHSEHWQAEGPQDLLPGQIVTIAGRDGLMLKVAPVEPKGGPENA